MEFWIFFFQNRQSLWPDFFLDISVVVLSVLRWKVFWKFSVVICYLHLLFTRTRERKTLPKFGKCARTVSRSRS